MLVGDDDIDSYSKAKPFLPILLSLVTRSDHLSTICALRSAYLAPTGHTKVCSLVGATAGLSVHSHAPGPGGFRGHILTTCQGATLFTRRCTHICCIVAFLVYVPDLIMQVRPSRVSSVPAQTELVACVHDLAGYNVNAR